MENSNKLVYATQTGQSQVLGGAMKNRIVTGFDENEGFVSSRRVSEILSASELVLTVGHFAICTRHYHTSRK